jgi:hypothetical protein
MSSHCPWSPRIGPPKEPSIRVSLLFPVQLFVSTFQDEVATRLLLISNYVTWLSAMTLTTRENNSDFEDLKRKT